MELATAGFRVWGFGVGVKGNEFKVGSGIRD